MNTRLAGSWLTVIMDPRIKPVLSLSKDPG
jgi:hypothetical protein